MTFTVAHLRWTSAKAGLPESVRAAFKESAVEPFEPFEVLMIRPVFRFRLPGDFGPSRLDAWVLGHCRGQIVSIAVEGTIDAPVGRTIQQWLAGPSDHNEKLHRLCSLCRGLGLPEVIPQTIRYTFLRHTYSAVLQALAINAQHATLLVHSFSLHDTSFEDYEAFVGLFGVAGRPDKITSCGQRSGVNLHCAWVRGEQVYRQM